MGVICIGENKHPYATLQKCYDTNGDVFKGGEPIYTSPPQQRKPLMDDMVIAAARALNKSHCQACNIDEEDSWMVYGSDYLHDARIALTAAIEIKGNL